ncbi:MAG: hypothetical protein R2819_10845 [Allomuricauda sp.]
MKHLLISTAVLFFGITFGQQRPQIQVSDEIIASIEKDVWIPFMEAYDESDSKKLKSIHSKNIIRVTLDQNQIEMGESYLEDFGNFVENVKEQGNKIGIAFAILTTALDESEQLAYQTGYYRFISQRPEDKDLVIRGYGKFHVGLKKEGGQWKIWLDSDRRIKLSHEDFKAQKIVYELRN